MKVRRVSAAGIELIKSYEKCRLRVYKDAAGNRTVGWGHLLGKNEKIKSRISQAAADELFTVDLHRTAFAVSSYLKTAGAKVSQREYNALVSLAFNIGSGAFRRSTVLTKLSKGDNIAAGCAFPMWNKAGGRRVLGLARRRVAEMNHYFG